MAGRLAGVAKRWWVIAAAAGGVVAAVFLFSWLFGSDAEPEIDLSQPTPLQQVLWEVRDDGTWSADTALRAFAAVYGPLPGVEVPEGPEPQIEFGTLPTRMLARHWDAITPEQRAAALELAGPFAAYLSGEPDPGFDAAPAPAGPPLAAAAYHFGGFPLGAAQAIGADEYGAMMQEIVDAIEPRIGRKLDLPIKIVVAKQQVGIFHALTWPVFEPGGKIVGCRTHLLPKAQQISGGNLVSVLAHETWHCYQNAQLGTKAAYEVMPNWIIEGQAMWVGETFVGGSDNFEPAIRHWKAFLVEPGPGLPLFARSYDAIGFYSHLADVGIDPWIVFDDMLDAPDNPEAFDAAVAGMGIEVLLTWAPGWFRDGLPTKTFSFVNAPGILGPDVRPPPLALNVSNGDVQQVATFLPLAAALGDATVSADVLTIDVVGLAMVGDVVFGDELRFEGGSRSFCMIEDCSCPDGSPGPQDHLGGELRIGATGTVTSASDVALRGWSLEDWCNEKPEAGGSDSSCDGGCASSNGDPHLTTVDLLAYDFQAAGEFTLLRSSDGAVELQARQEPFEDSTYVAINTAVAVGAAGHRVAVYADDDDVTVRVDGTPTTLAGAVTAGGLAAVPITDGVEISAPDGTVISVLGLGEWGLNVVVAPSPAMRRDGAGLLGPAAGEDLPRLPDGSALEFGDDPSGVLYGPFADAWAVTDETTLFDYEAGAGPATFRDPGFPEAGAPFNLADLDEALRLAGFEACAGIGDAALRDQCAFDVAVTGQEGFVDAYEVTETIVVGVSPEPPGSVVGGTLAPLLTGVVLIDGAALGGDGMLYLSVTRQGQTYELVAVDPATATVATRVDTQGGSIATAAGSVWLSESGAAGCAVRRFALGTLAQQATVEVPCWFSFLAPPVVAGDDAAWVYDFPFRLRRIDPADNSLSDGVGLPFAGYLQSSGGTIFVSEEGSDVFRLRPGADAFESLGPGHLIIYPGGAGFWEQTGDQIAFFDRAGAPARSFTVDDDRLVGATTRSALVQRRPSGEPELWAYPVAGGAPALLAVGPQVGTESEARQLDYFGNDPLLAGDDGVAKLWLVQASSGSGETAVYLQWIPGA